MKLIAELLRHPDEVAARCHDQAHQRRLAQLSLLLIVAGGVAFGAALGTFRGGSQLLYAALKIPVATLGTLAFCGPAFVAFAAAHGRRWSLRTTLALVLAAGARSSLVLLAFTPVLWLAIDLEASHRAIQLMATSCYGLAGLSALSLVLRALGPGAGRRGAATGFLFVFLLVGAQMAWLLRPYLGDPRDRVVPVFVHGRTEGGVAGTLLRAMTGERR